ncbi:MBL fold metallo-hydrolase [Shewanella sp. c952]|uniref:MBL fold metallo-hydrolase n=1 Tax=Shewanella sp. c952 TaxID=2815913 RepID=UPI0035B63486
MTFIHGEDSWTVIDPLLSPEASVAGLKLLKVNVENLPITGVIFTHSHIDHFGGCHITSRY